jgi:hypothetical protein
MLWPKTYLGTAANGHMTVNWPASGHSFFVLLRGWLRLRHGLRRSGRQVLSPDAIILPGLVGDGFRLRSGWDIWSGYYLLSEDRLGDLFLKRLAARAAKPGAAADPGRRGASS